MVAVLALAQTSCSSDDRVFDDSSANRMENALNEYKELLVSAENGWKLEMYSGENKEYGGANLFLNFKKDGTVSIVSDYSTGVKAGTTLTSNYELLKTQGPILSFSTYNDILHYWSEPSSSDVDGLEGDYEFIVVSASDKEFVLKGKKRGVTLHMYAVDKNYDIKSALTKMIAVRNSCSKMKLFEVIYENKTLGVGKFSGGYFQIDDFKSLYFATETGIRLANPVTIGSAQISEFEYDSKSGILIAKDVNLNIKPIDTRVPLSTFLNGTWYFMFDDAEGEEYVMPVKFIESDGQLYMYNREKQFELKVSYNASTGSIVIQPQVLEKDKSGNYVWMLTYNGSSIFVNTSYGLQSSMVNITDDYYIFSFDSYGTEGLYNTFVLYSFKSGKAPEVSGAVEYKDQWSNFALVLVK